MITDNEEEEFIDYIIDKEHKSDRLTSADEEMLNEEKIDDQGNDEDED